MFFFLSIHLNAQYTTNYPFDDHWVTNFNGPLFNLIDLGAIPNDTISDNVAFLIAADSIQYYGGGKLFIPAGTYIVGGQSVNPNPNLNTQYYQNSEIFAVEGVNNLIIEGEAGTTLKIRDGFRFGSFDPLSGEVYNHQPDSVDFTEPEYKAEVGDFFLFENSSNILIKNMELDGNNESLILGGYYGDVGIQLEASGIKLIGSSNIKIQNIHTHHHGLDGIEIAHYNLTPTSDSTVIVLENINSEYNGRQGLSWVGGIGLTAYNCQFNHTGKANILTPPASGVDIEAEDSVCRGGKFVKCEFINNGNTALVADSGDGGYSTFENCLFWGTSSSSLFINKPAMSFDHCQIYGTVNHSVGSLDDASLATKFTNCHFEDLEHPQYGVYRGNYLLELDMYNGGNVTIDHCTIVANDIHSIWITNELNVPSYIKNTEIIHKKQIENHDFIANFKHVSLENVQFMEEYPSDLTDIYYINLDEVEVGNCVTSENQHVKWESWNNESIVDNWVLTGLYLKEDTLALLTPLEDETLSLGSIYNLTWDFNNPNEFIEIQIFKGCEFFRTIENKTENDGLYTWLIPSDIPTSDDYRIKIVKKNNLHDFDFNDSSFSLINHTVGIDEDTNFIDEVKFFPNPFEDILSIVYSSYNEPLNYNFTIVNMLGEKINNYSGTINSLEREVKISLNFLSSGVYFVDVFNVKNKIGTYKVVKK